jgi:hypothetical protein
MALGCAFIFLVFLMCWRRRARKQRAKRTKAFADAKIKKVDGGWGGRMRRFGERLFGGNKQKKGDIELGGKDHIRLVAFNSREEEERHDREIENLIGAYEYSRAGSTRRTSGAPTSIADRSIHHHLHLDVKPSPLTRDGDRLSSGSLYSQITGLPKRIPEPRQPIKDSEMLVARHSTLSDSSWGSSTMRQELPPPPRDFPSRPVTPAQAYADEVRPGLSSTTPAGLGTGDQTWMKPMYTGKSNNPFLHH